MPSRHPPRATQPKRAWLYLKHLLTVISGLALVTWLFRLITATQNAPEDSLAASLKELVNIAEAEAAPYPTYLSILINPFSIESDSLSSLVNSLFLRDWQNQHLIHWLGFNINLERRWGVSISESQQELLVLGHYCAALAELITDFYAFIGQSLSDTNLHHIAVLEAKSRQLLTAAEDLFPCQIDSTWNFDISISGSPTLSYSQGIIDPFQIYNECQSYAILSKEWIKHGPLQPGLSYIESRAVTTLTYGITLLACVLAALTYGTTMLVSPLLQYSTRPVQRYYRYLRNQPLVSQTLDTNTDRYLRFIAAYRLETLRTVLFDQINADLLTAFDCLHGSTSSILSRGIQHNNDKFLATRTYLQQRIRQGLTLTAADMGLLENPKDKEAQLRRQAEKAITRFQRHFRQPRFQRHFRQPRGHAMAPIRRPKQAGNAHPQTTPKAQPNITTMTQRQENLNTCVNALAASASQVLLLNKDQLAQLVAALNNAATLLDDSPNDYSNLPLNTTGLVNTVNTCTQQGLYKGAWQQFEELKKIDDEDQDTSALKCLVHRLETFKKHHKIKIKPIPRAQHTKKPRRTTRRAGGSSTTTTATAATATTTVTTRKPTRGNSPSFQCKEDYSNQLDSVRQLITEGLAAAEGSLDPTGYKNQLAFIQELTEFLSHTSTSTIVKDSQSLLVNFNALSTDLSKRDDTIPFTDSLDVMSDIVNHFATNPSKDASETKAKTKPVIREWLQSSQHSQVVTKTAKPLQAAPLNRRGDQPLAVPAHKTPRYFQAFHIINRSGDSSTIERAINLYLHAGKLRNASPHRQDKKLANALVHLWIANFTRITNTQPTKIKRITLEELKSDLRPQQHLQIAQTMIVGLESIRQDAEPATRFLYLAMLTDRLKDGGLLIDKDDDTVILTSNDETYSAPAFQSCLPIRNLRNRLFHRADAFNEFMQQLDDQHTDSTWQDEIQTVTAQFDAAACQTLSRQLDVLSQLDDSPTAKAN